MKRNTILMSIILCGALASASAAYGFNPLSSTDWQTLASTIGVWLEQVFENAWTTLKNVPECTKVVPLGAEWAMKRATYQAALWGKEAAQSVLETLQKNGDPQIIAKRAEIVKLQTLKKAAQASKEAQLAGIAVARSIATATGTVGAGLVRLSKSFDIKRIELKAYLSDLAKGRIQRVGLWVVIAGFDINFNVQLDLSQSITDIGKAIFAAIVRGQLFGVPS